MAERNLIDTIRTRQQVTSTNLIKGIGDDCAVIQCGHSDNKVISTDMLVENIHFDLSFHPPYLLGRKSVAVNLSDVAAMGGTPEFILLSMALPSKIEERWIVQYIDGVVDICNQFGCQLIGGDTVTGAECSFSVTVIGRGPGQPVYRSGAKAGQDIYVSGELGSSGLGLELLKLSKTGENHEQFVNAHLNPLPMVGLGMQLGKSGVAAAMLDVSDGIATDLAHICKESRVGAEVEETTLPANPFFKQLCQKVNRDPLQLMLGGGEDYQLLFTAEQISRELIQKIEQDIDIPLTRIGKVTRGQGVYLIEASGNRKEISFQGYEHL